MGNLTMPPGFWALAGPVAVSAIIRPLATAARNWGLIFAASPKFIISRGPRRFSHLSHQPFDNGAAGRSRRRGQKVNGWSSASPSRWASDLHRTRTATVGTGTNWPFSTKAGRSVGIRQLPLWSISHCRGRLQRATAESGLSFIVWKSAAVGGKRLFDHLVGACEDRWRDRQAELFRGLE